jgi:ATP-binding cassette subfamily F protein uup
VAAAQEALRTRQSAATDRPARAGTAGSGGTAPAKKLSHHEKREFAALPGRIDALEAEVRRLNEAVAGPEFYKEGFEAIARTLARVEEVQRELDEAYARWVDLEPRSR